MAKQRRAPVPRGLDFYIRWAQGAWAERKVMEAINASAAWRAVPYGISRGDPLTFEEMKAYWVAYQARMAQYGKRPDLLIFRMERIDALPMQEGEKLARLVDLPNGEAAPLVAQATLAAEIETSLWKVKKAQEQGRELSFTIKEEDLEPLRTWVRQYQKPLAVIQVFYDQAHIFYFEELEALIRAGQVRAEVDPKTRKATYKVPLSRNRLFGILAEPPQVRAKILETDSGQIIPSVGFEGGQLAVVQEVFDEWERLSAR